MADLLYNGNYIHPRIEVVMINGLHIEGGRLYFPCPPWKGMPYIGARRRIEVISLTRIWQLLDLAPRDDGPAVEINLLVSP